MPMLWAPAYHMYIMGNRYRMYCISLNYSCSSSNCLPWIINLLPPLDGNIKQLLDEVFVISRVIKVEVEVGLRLIIPTPLTFLSFFYPLPVELKWNLMQQNWSVTIQALMLRLLTLEINQGTKFGRLKKPMCDHFFVLMGKIWNNRLPQIISLFLCEKNNNRPSFYSRKYSICRCRLEMFWFLVSAKGPIKQHQQIDLLNQS